MICHFLIQSGKTSLMWASLGGHVECIKMLLEGGAQANQQNKVSGYRLVHVLLVMCIFVICVGCGSDL